MEDFKHGDTILVSRKFRFSIGGFVQIFIRFFQNILYVSTFQFKKVSIYHHVASIVFKNGQLCVYEAIDKGYVNSGNVYDYVIHPSMHKYLIKRPLFELNTVAYENAQDAMLGKEYWFWGTLFFQCIKQLTLDTVWLGSNKENTKKVYCSHAGAKALYEGSNKQYFKRHYATDPQDLYISKHLFTVKKND